MKFGTYPCIICLDTFQRRVVFIKIALISCAKEKRNYPCAAHDLYSASTLFSASYKYAKSRADKIFILSAKYGLVPENMTITPYNQTLKEINRKQQLDWARMVIKSLHKECDIESDEFMILAGRVYYQDLIQALPHYYLPLGSLRMGERISWLNKANSCIDTNPIIAPAKAELYHPNLANICVQLHELFCHMHRYTWNQISDIPFNNGIYIVFEKGETYHSMDRIVRVGTHTAPNRLKPRLSDHFVRENHDGSIFRKNIGKAILTADNDPYIINWTKDTSKLENKLFRDEKKNVEIESRVSKYLRNNFTFSVFRVEDCKERLRLEEAIISTLNQADDFKPSEKWAGRFSPEIKIRTSGMWLKQGLDSAPLTMDEMVILKKRCYDISEQDNTIQIQTNKELPFVHSIVQSATRQKHGKYTPLFQYFSIQKTEVVNLTFADIEKIISQKLPPSAKKYTMWWVGHNHCKAWTDAGYKAVNIAHGIDTQVMTFNRQ